MAEQDYANLLSQGGGYPGSAGAAFASFTALQDISPLPLPLSYGYQLRVGSKIQLRADGEFSNTGTPTLSMAFLYGPTAGAAGTPAVFAQTSVITTTTGATNWPWRFEADGVVTGASASGSIIVQGVFYLGTSLTVFAAPVPAPITQALRTVTVDTTVNKLWGVGAAWGASSASNSIKVNNFSALLLN